MKFVLMLIAMFAFLAAFTMAIPPSLRKRQTEIRESTVKKIDCSLEANQDRPECQDVDEDVDPTLVEERTEFTHEEKPVNTMHFHRGWGGGWGGWRGGWGGYPYGGYGGYGYPYGGYGFGRRWW